MPVLYGGSINLGIGSSQALFAEYLAWASAEIHVDVSTSRTARIGRALTEVAEETAGTSFSRHARRMRSHWQIDLAIWAARRR